MATTRDFDRVVRKFIDPKVKDNVFNSTPLLQRFRKNAKIRTYGTKIVEPLEYAEGIGGAYNDLEVIDAQRKEVVINAEYDLKQYYAGLVVSWKDKLICQGPEDVVGLLQVKARNAEKTMSKHLTTGITGDGSDAKHFEGLQKLIYAGSSNTAGGLSSATYSWWANKTNNKSSSTLTYPDIVNMIADCSDGNDKPTLIATDKYIWAYIWANLLQPQERYTGGRYNTAEDLPSVAGIPILWDAAFESSGSTGGKMYFINENHLFLRIHKADNMKYWPYMKADNQFAFKAYWTLSGALVCNNRKRQGVIYGITVS